jgi:hypothetical protein
MTAGRPTARAGNNAYSVEIASIVAQKQQKPFTVSYSSMAKLKNTRISTSLKEFLPGARAPQQVLIDKFSSVRKAFWIIFKR